jgi:hypothetical protein
MKLFAVFNQYPTLLFLPLIALMSCDPKNDGAGEQVEPSNLELTITQDSTVLGRVEVQASADNANYLEAEFFEDGSSTVQELENGLTSYQFQDTGRYRILVRAHTSFDVFIQEERFVSISRDGNGSGGGPQGIPDTGYSTPMSYPGYTLVWNDEFNGNSLSSDWVHETGTGSNGWGNNELQYYRPENTEVRDGYLIITAKNEIFGSQSYTSSRIKTQGLQSFQYGRIDIRAALPQGQGIWPALWMLGDSHSTVGWPACGEIDIMEMVGGTHQQPQGNAYVHGTIHWEQNGQRAQYGGHNKLDQGIFADEFHVFSIEWDQNGITWYRDDIAYHSADITPAPLSEFQAPFFFIFNVAVGGNWPGPPDNSTQFPQQMAVDYVRVFQ